MRPACSARSPKAPGRRRSRRRRSSTCRVGGRYIVAEAFTDYDGDLHPPGESWTFLTQHFVPYHDGLSLFVSLDGEREWQIRLHWTPEGQGAVIDALESIVRPA